MDTTVIKGLRVLEHLSLASEPIMLSHLARDLGLQKSNAHRLLTTLKSEGYVDQEIDSGRYFATLRTWELGVSRLMSHPLKAQVSASLQEVHRSLGETVNLAMFLGKQMIYLDKIHAPRPFDFYTHVGSRVSTLRTSSGRVVLAFRSDSEAQLDDILASEDPASNDSRADILRDLADIREKGYATIEGQFVSEIKGIATPISDVKGEAIGALSCSGPILRIRSKEDRIISTLKSVSDKIRISA